MLKKLFKSRQPHEEIDPGEEPARVRAPVVSTHPLKKRTEASVTPTKGFDPYNSGTFRKENAWERVTRK